MKILMFLLFLLLKSFLEKEEQNIIVLNIDCKSYLNYCVIPISFGEKNEVFTIQLDTTISETWIPSSKFDLDVQKYDISNSKNGNKTKKKITIYDENGYISGKICYDSIKLKNKIIENYGFVLADNHNSEFKDYPKGKLGLGYAQNQEVNFNIVKKLKEMNYIDKELFLIDRYSNELIIGEIPKFLDDFPYESCSLIDISYLDPEFSHSWACELYKVFFGVYETTETGVYTDKNGISFPYSYTYTNFDIATDVYGPVIFDSAIQYIYFPKKYLKDFKENFISKFLNNKCKRQLAENLDLFFICDKRYVEFNKNYISFFIHRKMYYLFGYNLFKPFNDHDFELLIRFPNKLDVFKLGAPFLNNWYTIYDYENEEIIFYGPNIKSFTSEYIQYRAGSIFLDILKFIGIIFIIIIILGCICSVIANIMKNIC